MLIDEQLRERLADLSSRLQGTLARSRPGGESTVVSRTEHVMTSEDATVLFTNMVGSTSLAPDDADDLRRGTSRCCASRCLGRRRRGEVSPETG